MSLIDPAASLRGADIRPTAETGWLSKAVLAAVARLRRYAEDRRAMAQLQAMPDWQLHDIGIRRHDIPAAVAGRIRRSRMEPLQ